MESLKTRIWKLKQREVSLINSNILREKLDRLYMEASHL